MIEIYAIDLIYRVREHALGGMMSHRILIFVVGVIAGVNGVSAQDYPNKHIRILTSEAGGGTDFTARVIAQGLTASLGQQVIVDNRVAVIAQDVAAKASPDGYTLLVSSGSLWIAPLLRKMRSDPFGDFSPITMATSSPTILVVNPSVRASSVNELIKLAKAEPGKLSYASGVTGSASQLAAELFNYMAGIGIVRISYKGGAPALIDLVGGRVQVMFPNGPTVVSYIKSGKLRALAVGSAQPSALLPKLPTVASSGLPGFEAALVAAVFAPARTPTAIVQRLNSEILHVLKRNDVKETFFNAGVDVVANSPQELTAAIKDEMARTDKVIKASGTSQ